MADENNQEKINELKKYDFLIDIDAKELFAELDYFLRQGQHIQYKHDKQTLLFNFIYKNEDSLKLYYKDFLRVNLLSNKTTDKFNKYYYLGFDAGNRGMVRKGNYEYLDKKHIIIGLVFWELYELDLNYPESLSKFYEILFNHDIYKDSFLRLFANINNETKDMYEDIDIIKNEIEKAFGKFEELGWIVFENSNKSEKNIFSVMPSFKRLTEEQYKNDIENYEILCKEILK